MALCHRLAVGGTLERADWQQQQKTPGTPKYELLFAIAAILCAQTRLRDGGDTIDKVGGVGGVATATSCIAPLLARWLCPDFWRSRAHTHAHRLWHPLCGYRCGDRLLATPTQCGTHPRIPYSSISAGPKTGATCKAKIEAHSACDAPHFEVVSCASLAQETAARLSSRQIGATDPWNPGDSAAECFYTPR